MKKLILFLFISYFFVHPTEVLSQQAKNMVLLDSLTIAELAMVQHPDSFIITDVWGYVDVSGDEFALIGKDSDGFGIVDVTDPTNIYRIESYISGGETFDVKTYENYAYVANDNGLRGWWPTNPNDIDVKIVNIANPNSPFVESTIQVGASSDIKRVHNIYIEDGIMYLACLGNHSDDPVIPDIYIYNLRQDPVNPVRIGEFRLPSFTSTYYARFPDDPEEILSTTTRCHDIYVKDNRIYFAATSTGLFVAEFLDTWQSGVLVGRTIDTTKTWRISYQAIRNPNFPYGPDWRVTHSVWVTDDHDYVFVTDETLSPPDTNQNDGGILRMFDISDINTWPVVPATNFLEPIQWYDVPEDSGEGVIGSGTNYLYPNVPANSVHNILLLNGFAFVSYYTKGLRILDISDPLHWEEAGYYDTPANAHTQGVYAGSWGVYPFLPSGTILLSDFDGLRTFKFGESGTISQNTTWSGRKYITGNVTVAQNVTLTIQPGSEIKFLDGKKITVNGTLVLNGSAEDTIRISSMTGQTGYGFKVRSIAEPGAQATMNYCRLENLSVGIEAINANISIQNSLLKGCTKGIYLQNSSADINDNSIIGCSMGIYVDGSSPQVFDNNIYGCSLNGIYVLSGSGTYLRNTIENCGEIDSPTSGGFYAVDGAEAVLEDESDYALNAIINNNRFGIRADVLSTIFAGYDVAGGNNIYGNSQYDAEALGSSTIDALYNYWGTATPGKKQFHTDSESTSIMIPG